MRHKIVKCKSYYWNFCKETKADKNGNRDYCKHEKCSKFKVKQKEVVKMKGKIGTDAIDMLELAWVIIANAGGGNWETQTKDWQKAAAKWRNKYHKLLKGQKGDRDEKRIKPMNKN